MTAEERESQDFPASLKVYSVESAGKGDRLVLITFVLAFVGVGLFSVTRLFLLHWVWLIPVSLGSASLLGIVLVALKFQEKPQAIIQVGEKDLRVVPVTFSGQPDLCRPLSDVTAIRTGERVSPPEGFRLVASGEELCALHLVGVRDVSLYQQIFDYFSLPAAERPPIASRERTQKAVRKNLSWFLLAYGLIALLLAGWAIYQNTITPGTDTSFPVPSISR